jgi:Rieske Fe-S protein
MSRTRIEPKPDDPYRIGDDPRAPIDVRVSNETREGLAGTTPASVYKPLTDDETITTAPDFRPLNEQPQWRKDFPVDWPEDHYVARRDFTKFLVITSLAMVVGQGWIGVQNWWRRRKGWPEIRKIASLSAIPVGGTVVFSYPEHHDKCILIRPEADVLLAYSQKCTHLSCAVIPNVGEGVIKCPCHEGYFDLRTGGVLAGPPPRPLPRITLDVRGDDIYATGIEWRTV